jgi:hypothetical protein
MKRNRESGQALIFVGLQMLAELAHATTAAICRLRLGVVLLFITALATIGNGGKILREGVSHRTIAAETLRVLDQLLSVLMVVEILHTVRISIRSHYLVTEPFLVVGLIASIRRILVITLEAATLRVGRGRSRVPAFFEPARLSLDCWLACPGLGVFYNALFNKLLNGECDKNLRFGQDSKDFLDSRKKIFDSERLRDVSVHSSTKTPFFVARHCVSRHGNYRDMFPTLQFALANRGCRL